MINIVIPMAGRGSRFEEAGYTFPKPLIEINQRPMIQIVAENLRPAEEHRFIFICQQSHYDKYALKETLGQVAPGCEIVPIDGITGGAACTVLLAADHFASDEELLIANSDQFVEFDVGEFIGHARSEDLDGDILSFPASHPKWSIAKRNDEGLVIEVAEKRPISDEATVGIYYYRRGQDFVDAAEQMIKKDIRTNGEFYVCPVYNQMILSGKRIGAHQIEASKMHGLGTPEDLERFLKTDVCASLAP